METFKCCICGEECVGYGNNPHPIKTEGRCCDVCNNLVILERIRLMQICNLVSTKVETELREANITKGIEGVNEILKKYNYEELMIK